MGHGFEDNDQMFSVRKRPWHNLGVVLNNPPSIREAIDIAGLNWKVGMEPLYTKDKTKVEVQATYRFIDKKKEILGIVGMDYFPLQNIDAFEWFNPLVKEGLVELESAGSLFSGKKIWILAKIKGDNLIIQKDDEIERFILLSNSHDGTMAVRVGFTPVRVVCNNTLTLAHSNVESRLLKVKHNYNVFKNIMNIRETMDLINKEFITTVEGFKYLASMQINSEDLKKYVKQVFSVKKLEESLNTEENSKKQKEHKRITETITYLFESGRGSYLSKTKTMWDAYNAVQEYLQYEKRTTDEMRYASLWFADGKNLNRKALQLALNYKMNYQLEYV